MRTIYVSVFALIYSFTVIYMQETSADVRNIVTHIMCVCRAARCVCCLESKRSINDVIILKIFAMCGGSWMCGLRRSVEPAHYPIAISRCFLYYH